MGMTSSLSWCECWGQGRGLVRAAGGGEQLSYARLGPEAADGARGGALDRARRDAEQGGDLGLAAVIEVTQDDDGPLLRRQRAERRQQGRPQLDRSQPVAGPRVAAVGRRVQAELARSALLRPGPVDDDVVQDPAAERAGVVDLCPAGR